MCAGLPADASKPANPQLWPCAVASHPLPACAGGQTRHSQTARDGNSAAASAAPETQQSGCVTERQQDQSRGRRQQLRVADARLPR